MAIPSIAPGATAYGSWAAESPAQVGAAATVTFAAGVWSGIAAGTFRTGMMVYLSTTDTLPAGVAVGTNYFLRDLGDDTFTLHATYAGAVANTGTVTPTDSGTGTHTLTPAFLDVAPGFHWVTGYDESITKTIMLAAFPDGGICDSNEILILFRAWHPNGVASCEVAADEGTYIEAVPIACQCPREPKNVAGITAEADTSLPWIDAIYVAKVTTAAYETAGLSDATRQSEIRVRVNPYQAGEQYIAQGLTEAGYDYDRLSLRLWVDVKTTPVRYCAVVAPTGTCTDTTAVLTLSSSADDAGLAAGALYADLATAITQIRTKATASDDNLNAAVVFLRDGVYTVPVSIAYSPKCYTSIVPSSHAVGTPRMLGGYSSDGPRTNMKRWRFRGVDWHVPFPKSTRYTVTAEDTDTQQITVSADLTAVVDGSMCQAFPLGAGTIATGLSYSTVYYLHKVSVGESSVITLHTSRGQAVRAESPVALGTAGTGTRYIETVNVTQTVFQFTVNTGTNLCTLASGTFSAEWTHQDVEVWATGADSLPAELAVATKYWVRAASTSTFKFYATEEDAAKSQNEIDLTTEGSGTRYLFLIQNSAFTIIYPSQASKIVRFENVDFICQHNTIGISWATSAYPSFVGCTLNTARSGFSGSLIQGCEVSNLTEDCLQEGAGFTPLVLDTVYTTVGKRLANHCDAFAPYTGATGQSLYNVRYTDCDLGFNPALPGGAVTNVVYDQPSWYELGAANNYSIVGQPGYIGGVSMHISSDAEVYHQYRLSDVNPTGLLIGTVFKQQSWTTQTGSTNSAAEIQAGICATGNVLIQAAASNDMRFGDYTTDTPDWTAYAPTAAGNLEAGVALTGIRTTPIDVNGASRYLDTAATAIGAIRAESEVVFVSAAAGNWNSGATWGHDGNNVEGSGYPSITQDATIADGHTVTLTAESSCKNLTIASGGTLVGGAQTLHVAGNWDSSAGTFTYQTSTVDLTGTGTVAVPGTTYTRYFYNLTCAASSKTTTLASNVGVANVLTLGAGAVAESGTRYLYLMCDSTTPLVNGGSTVSIGRLYYRAASGTINVAAGTYTTAMYLYGNAGVTFNLAGVLNLGSGLLTLWNASTGTVSVATANNAITCGGISFGLSSVVYPIALSAGSSAITLGASGLVVASNGGSHTLNLGSATISNAGPWTMVNGTGTITVTPGTSVVTFNATSGTKAITSNSQRFWGLTFNGTGGTFTLADAAYCQNYTQTAGTINVTTTLTVEDNVTQTGGTLNGVITLVSITPTGRLSSIQSQFDDAGSEETGAQAVYLDPGNHPIDWATGLAITFPTDGSSVVVLSTDKRGIVMIGPAGYKPLTQNVSY